MAYTETPQSNLNNTAINYNDGVASFGTDLEVTVPLEVIAVGAVIVTAYTGMTTSQVVSMQRATAAARSTFTSNDTLTITNQAAGNVVLNRISNPTRYFPGDIIRTRITTQGVGTAGTAKIFFVTKYYPVSDQSNMSIVTA